jgi:hypothetical protein
MPHDLDQLKSGIPTLLQERGFSIFHGVSRISEDENVIYWDSEKHPDHREFLECASSLGIKVIVMHTREFAATALDDVQAELEDSSLPPSERRELEKRIKALRPYTGFTGNLELSFDHEGLTYMFELRSEFMEELVSIINEVEDSMYPPPELDLDEEVDEEDDDDKPGGGFYSRN